MHKTILITGGAGFVGSNFALKLKSKYPDSEILVLDNLKRRGSELNLPRLKDADVNFFHGDIRNQEDFEQLPEFDLVIEASAEPSVLAGITSSPKYLLNTNLVGTLNCLEATRKNNADMIFLSTSRVYPIDKINTLNYEENDTRFFLKKQQPLAGVSDKGIAEIFPLGGARSLYGATKLCSEIMLQEYINEYGIKAVINRCGVITGPWQFGKVDQGVFVLWVAKHIFKGSLKYIGWGGTGKQVRDFIHIDDLFELIDMQINNLSGFNNQTYNIAGGLENSVSLLELTHACEKITGNKISIGSVKETRPADLKLFIADCSKIQKQTGWKPKIRLSQTVQDIADWINSNTQQLEPILK